MYVDGQRWQKALSSHIAYSNSFLRCGVSDDENDEDNQIISVGSMADTLQVGLAGLFLETGWMFRNMKRDLHIEFIVTMDK